MLNHGMNVLLLRKVIISRRVRKRSHMTSATRGGPKPADVIYDVICERFITLISECSLNIANYVIYYPTQIV